MAPRQEQCLWAGVQVMVAGGHCVRMQQSQKGHGGCGKDVGIIKSHEIWVHEWPRKSIRYNPGRRTTLSGTNANPKASESSHLQSRLDRWARILLWLIECFSFSYLYFSIFSKLPMVGS